MAVAIEVTSKKDSKNDYLLLLSPAWPSHFISPPVWNNKHFFASDIFYSHLNQEKTVPAAVLAPQSLIFVSILKTCP